MPETYYDRHFPQLRSLGFKRTSEPAYYNCVAFAVGDDKRKWWPGEYHPFWKDDYWPHGVPNDESLVAFVQALATVQFVPCADENMEEGMEKVVIYGHGENEVRHMAKQMDDGTWRSKLGEDEDIEHTLAGLAGPFYGRILAFLKRPKTASSSNR